MTNTSFMAPQRSGVGNGIGKSAGLAQRRDSAWPAAPLPTLGVLQVPRRAPAQLPLFQPPGSALR